MDQLRQRVKRTYRCVVIEEGSQCDEHFQAFLSPAEVYEFGTSSFICENHLDRGYSWLSDIMGDKSVKIEHIAHYEFNEGEWKLVGDESPGIRNEELYTRPFSLVSDRWGSDVGAGATGVPIKEMTEPQKESSDRGKRVLRGWGVVQKFDDDTLMLPLEDAIDPQNPTVVRKVRKIVGGFSKAPTPKDGDVF